MSNKSLKVIFGLFALLLIFAIFLIVYISKFVPQGHGSTATYIFGSSKYVIEKKIDSLILHSKEISRKLVHKKNKDDYYNTEGYFTILIKNTSFCFRFYGDKNDWDKSPYKSEIFIAFVSNNNTAISRPPLENLKLVESTFINKLISINNPLLKRKINNDYYNGD